MAFLVAPGRKQYHCHMEPARRDTVIRWLAAGGPREWHIAADIWNWDSGHDILALISEQPECDGSTAQLIYARAEASYYVTDPEAFAKGKSDSGSVFNLVLDMLARWRSGFYTSRKFRLPEDDTNTWANVVLSYQLEVIDRWNRDPELMLPRDFIFLPYGERPNVDWIKIPQEIKEIVG